MLGGGQGSAAGEGAVTKAVAAGEGGREPRAGRGAGTRQVGATPRGARLGEVVGDSVERGEARVGGGGVCGGAWWAAASKVAAT